MRKLLLGFLFCALVIPVYAGGTADITNCTQGPASAAVELEIIYDNGGAAWTAGALAISFPAEFPTLPSIVPTDGGYVEAFVMNGTTAVSQLPNANFAIEARTVTITGIALNPGETVKVIYGSRSGFGPGADMPSAEGSHTVNIMESADGLAFNALGSMPLLYIEAMSICKTADVAEVMQNMTFTYTVAVANLSNTTNLSNVTVTDSLPDGLVPLSVWADAGTPSFTGKDVSVVYSLLGASEQKNLYIEVYVQPGVINYGTTLTNYAVVSSASSYTRDNGASVNVKGGKLTPSFAAAPGLVYPDQFITVALTLENSGNNMLAMVTPLAPSVTGTGSVMLYSSPPVPYLSGLGSGTTGSFTWVYKATIPGVVWFTTSATGLENGVYVSTGIVSSNQVIIDLLPTVTPTWTGTPGITPTWTNTVSPVTPTAYPTATFTAMVPTGTFTPQLPTDTPTYTATPVVPTDTFTRTVTPVPTGTFTKTPTTYISATPTNTSTKTATPNLTPPTSTPTQVDAAKTDRNYINTANGDLLKISYKVTTGGKTRIKIFNLNGEEVKSFYDADLAAGNYEAFWDGSNNAGKKVGRGMYFIIVNQPDGKTTKKVVVTK